MRGFPLSEPVFERVLFKEHPHDFFPPDYHLSVGLMLWENSLSLNAKCFINCRGREALDQCY